MMSAHLPQAIISAASVVRGAETATCADAVCAIVCRRACVSLRVCERDGNKAVGLYEDRVAV